ncbi:uncharacterized protein EV420DRAFT_1637864 [Desarmillaria tabescens]|uniref:Uncharacterized protein n=1 Tax=Armillaria tabescens TaxID=1929756 RepID=A0AA39TV22_ARMTA|nr:uncharacterized protein EV420DRAFT_1637864 [Desarmillaria tabescens]KAK0464294.1 hypothetical protein EV420DRAFT_1637864 [Desarmillaria tabescens]
MTTLSLSWREFLHLRFPSHPSILEPASTETVPYSANIPPEPEESLRQSSLDPSFLDRVLLPLEAFIEQLGIIDDPVPLYVARSISILFEILQNVRMVVLEAVVALESSFSVDLVHVSELELETGEMNLFTHNIDIHEDVKAVSVEIKHPRVLYRYATELRESQVCEPVGQEGGKAMAVKEYTCTPWAKFGLFFSGVSAILMERVTYDSGEHALLVSPHYHLFDDDNPPVCNSCTPHDEGGIPLLAVLTGLLFPNVIVDNMTRLPALVNPLKVRSSKRSSISTGSGSVQGKPALVDVERNLKIASIPSAIIQVYLRLLE